MESIVRRTNEEVVEKIIAEKGSELQQRIISNTPFGNILIFTFMRLNFILPFFPIKPGGGCKIMYEYANRLAQKGYDVKVYHVATLPNMAYKYPHWLRYLRNCILYLHSKPSWFTFHKDVQFKNIPCLEDRYIRNADFSISTMWATAIELSKLRETTGRKINLIQDYELWIGNNKELLHSTYRLPIIHVTISDFLAEIVKKESGLNPYIIYNGIDNTVFKIKNDIEKRNPYSVSMLYSIEKRKGSWYGLKALEACHKVCPQLKVELFGVYPKPKGLPSWIHYNQNPKDLYSVYNSTAIFFTPSNNEGWGLPATEALFCGCALVCTDIKGHQAFAINKETCLTVQPQNVNDMTKKLLQLLLNNEERINLAYKGNSFVDKFKWDASIDKFCEVLDTN